MSEEVAFRELMYAENEVWEIIKKKFPSAICTDASDEVHLNRFEVEIEGVTADEFYPFAIKEGLAGCCFGLRVKIGMPNRTQESTDEINRWAKTAREEVDHE